LTISRHANTLGSEIEIRYARYYVQVAKPAWAGGSGAKNKSTPTRLKFIQEPWNLALPEQSNTSPRLQVTTSLPVSHEVKKHRLPWPNAAF
jgi:hypothetical protein